MTHMNQTKSIRNFLQPFLLVICLAFFLFSSSSVTVVGSYSDHGLKANPDFISSETTGAIIRQDGDRLERFIFNSPELRIKQREIFVYLPPDYFSSDKSYPVIYLHDGSMLFSTNGNHDSRFNIPLDELFVNGESAGIIAVGISSSQNRWDEYSPWVNENMDIWAHWAAEQVEGGEGDAYLDFTINTLKPYIDENYRTLDDRENTAIGGFSMGGLISIYAGLKHPDVFSKVMAMSPAVWFAEEDRAWKSQNQLIRLIRDEKVPHDVKFYLDIGTNEWVIYEVPLYDENGNQYTYPFIWVDGTDMVFNELEARNIPDENLLLVVDEGGVHEPADWNARFYDAVVWLFDGPVVPDEAGMVAIVPPEEAVIVNTPILSLTKEHETPATEIHVVGVDGKQFQYSAILIGIALLIGSVLIFLWINKRYR